jgi:hypothetical protein
MAKSNSLNLLILALLSIAVSGSVHAQNDAKGSRLNTCTLLACRSEADISIWRSGHQPPAYNVRVEIDGHSVTCAAPTDQILGPFGAKCEGDIYISIDEAFDCSVQCVDMGKREERLRIMGTPKRIKITLFDANRRALERVFLPEYAIHSPNGSDCLPHCAFWRSTVVVD